MTIQAQDRRQQILALEPRLLGCADAMTRDVHEARALVQDTLAAAQERGYGEADASTAQTWLFRLMRQRFHSVERDRDYRRSRSAQVTELAYARKREQAAQAAVQEALDAR
jgi:DNA-directed RNA polymerase specialized sigma24 family protein